MQRYDRLLLNVWREASRHIEIGRSTAKIACLLAERLPLAEISVQRLDLQHARLWPVAAHAFDAQAKSTPLHLDLSPAQLKSLVAWGSQKKVLRQPSNSASEVLKFLAPLCFDDETLVGPLWGADHMEGVLILRLSQAVSPEDKCEELAEAILEPFGAALEIDRRLSELEALKEKAEADRRSLLTKLGRKEMAAPIVGAEAGLLHVMERVEMISRSDVAVLLLGETGTGKEVVARAIHTRSERRDGPLVRVNCGAIPAELIDSQLFGHERGSFTGAVDTHQGWFERADGGTLFLDEIAELPLAAQVRLLRVLQDGFIERIGGKQPIHVDVRVIAATHRDVAQMTKDGAFRQDLWYRIAVFPIPIPPLRERTEDIQALACHFAEKAAVRFGLALVMPTPEDLRLLTTYPWPGNVRELAAVIDRAALLGNGRHLEIAKSLGVMPPVQAPAPYSNAGSYSASPGSPAALKPARDDRDATRLSLDDAMKIHIEDALRACHGRIEGPFGAAKRLAVNPHTLRSRMRKFGVDWRRFRISE